MNRPLGQRLSAQAAIAARSSSLSSNMLATGGMGGAAPAAVRVLIRAAAVVAEVFTVASSPTNVGMKTSPTP